MGVKIQVLGLNEAINNIDHYITRKKNALERTVAEAGKETTSAAQGKVPIDLGELRASIGYTIMGRKDKIETEVLASAPYAAYVEFGTSPHFPPPKALEGWAQRHGFGEGGGYIVARKISQRGTPAQPYMYPAYQKVKPKFIRAVKKVMSQP